MLSRAAGGWLGFGAHLGDAGDSEHQCKVGYVWIGVGEGEGFFEGGFGGFGFTEAVVGEGEEEVVFGVAAGLEVFVEDEQVGQ